MLNQPMMERCCLSSAISIVIMFESLVIASADPKILSAPSENVVVPLGQTTLENFNCIANGSSSVLWILNESIIHHIDQDSYEDLGITFHEDNSFASPGFLISIGIDVTTARLNNTRLSCFAFNFTTQRNSTSQEVSLTIAGPPLAPHPNFRVVNATHIEVQWDKPFAFPEFDVRNYLLLILNSSSESNSTRNETISVSADTTYPIRYYLNNRGDIPKECMYMNFLLTAINDAGRSDVGSVIGGFPIAPSPIMDDAKSLQHKVTFTSDFIPTLHINFTFPTVCDYHDAKYSITILSGGGSLVYQSLEKTYNNDLPDNVEVTIGQKLQKDSLYTAEINVSTAVNWTITHFKFDTNITPKERGVVNNAVAGNRDTTVIISSSIAAGLCVILLGLIAIMMTVVILRRRKLRRRNRAHQRELETDEAVQRAAQAMVTNPIYSGNPIYEEICDSTMLKSVRNGVGISAETTSRDKDYVAISADAVKNVNWFPVPEESKMVEDKYATFPEDTYTFMNPAGTLSNQSRGPAYEVPFVHSSMHYGNGVLPEQNRLTEANRVITNGEYCAAAAGSAPATTGFNTQDEERYVKGAF